MVVTFLSQGNHFTPPFNKARVGVHGGDHGVQSEWLIRAVQWETKEGTVKF